MRYVDWAVKYKFLHSAELDLKVTLYWQPEARRQGGFDRFYVFRYLAYRFAAAYGRRLGEHQRHSPGTRIRCLHS